MCPPPRRASPPFCICIPCRVSVFLSGCMCFMSCLVSLSYFLSVLSLPLFAGCFLLSLLCLRNCLSCVSPFYFLFVFPLSCPSVVSVVPLFPFLSFPCLCFFAVFLCVCAVFSLFALCLLPPLSFFVSCSFVLCLFFCAPLPVCVSSFTAAYSKPWHTRRCQPITAGLR